MTTQYAYAPGQIPVWTFADKIRKARDITGDNQKQFADRINITASTLAAYETGRSTPRFKDAGSLANRLQIATGIPAAWFLVEDDPNTSGPGNEKMPPTPKSEGLKLPELDSNQQPAG
jgi:transcriptional regulator with XRE-family HTH domain